MSAAEVNYAQIEKEMLSMVFAVEKFHQYVFDEGRRVQFVSNMTEVLGTLK